MKSENNNNDRNDWHVNCSKGVLDAIIEIGTRLDHFYDEKNDLPDGGMEALIDTVDDLIGGMGEGASIPDSYEKHLSQEGRCTGYLHTLIILRNLASLKGI